MDALVYESTIRLKDALRARDNMLQVLIQSRSYEEAKVVFWEMHALNRQLQLVQGDAVAASR